MSNGANSAGPPGPAGEAVSALEYRVRRDEGRLVLLPSGDTVRVRYVWAADLARQGSIPDTLVQHVYRELDDLRAEALGKGEEDPGVRLERERTDTIDLVAAAMLIEPRMVVGLAPEAAPDAIAPADMPWHDRLYLFTLAGGQLEQEVGGLGRFPGRPAPGVGASPNGDRVLDDPELAPGPAAG